MRVTFVGVGEAFDPAYANTSILVEDAGRLLLDCGFTAAHAYWKTASRPGRLDAVWVSHLHGDHFFGLPALLLALREAGRSAPLTVIGRPGVRQAVTQAMGLAYGSLLEANPYAVEFLEVAPGERAELAGFTLGFAANDHSAPCLGVRVDAASGSLFYSGDGAPTEATAELAAGVDLVVHESYGLDPHTPGHGTVAASLDFARRAGAAALACVHVNARVRHTQGERIREMLQAERALAAWLPEPGEVWETC